MAESKLITYLMSENLRDACFIGSPFLFKRFYRQHFKSVEERKKALNKGYGRRKPTPLMCVLSDQDHPRASYKIAKFLIREGADVNYPRGDGKNALQDFYCSVWRGKPRHYLRVTKLLVKSGIDINHLDKYGISALGFLLSNNRNEFHRMRKVYLYLLRVGADYRRKEHQGKSCLEFAQESPSLAGFVELVREFESGRYS